MKKGFTLIELLVVIAIVTMLASIMFGVVSTARDKALRTRALSEMDQIIKAANIVYTEYGYYPNDSHGSIVCPRDIVIDQVSGKTWGDYIPVCEDPFGNPYEWDNTCDNGLTRKPHAPYNVSCESFSDTGPGPVGVTMIGIDGNNDGCTGDDFCLGERGHALYANGLNIIAIEPVLSCTAVVSSCSNLTTFECSTRSGCTLNGATCSGTYTQACSGFADQTSCQNQASCSWSGGGCSGTPSTSCSSYASNQTSCQNLGCSFTAGACSGSVSACTTWNGNQATCLTQTGCSYSTGNNKCTGTHSACSTNASQTSCQTNLSCSWTASNCTGSPSACSTKGSSASCTAVSGCSWATSACSGTYGTSCSGLNSQSSCQGQANCTWNAASCTGTASTCSTYSTQTSCSAQSGCSWE